METKGEWQRADRAWQLPAPSRPTEEKRKPLWEGKEREWKGRKSKQERKKLRMSGTYEAGPPAAKTSLFPHNMQKGVLGEPTGTSPAPSCPDPFRSCGEIFPEHPFPRWEEEERCSCGQHTRPFTPSKSTHDVQVKGANKRTQSRRNLGPTGPCSEGTSWGYGEVCEQNL